MIRKRQLCSILDGVRLLLIREERTPVQLGKQAEPFPVSADTSLLVAPSTDLGYAATAYGIQGATVDASHTLLSETTSAAGVYVGMTRGRETNRLHVVVENLADARAQFIKAMERDPAHRDFDHATAQASKSYVTSSRRSRPTRRTSNGRQRNECGSSLAPFERDLYRRDPRRERLTRGM